MSEYNKYLHIVWGECVHNLNDPRVEVGKKYRLGVRYNQDCKKEVYYILDIKDALGRPIIAEIESELFKEEELNSISFIMT